uniref:GGNG-1 n=1 Tax=Charonia tritonis TaxID=1960912 RepID=A0A1S6JQ27_9CAEN|nr:GGNG-1 precursor [Charonia tritonis]
MMKTDTAQTLCIALTSFVVLSAVFSPTEGKCAGRWAIHACWGGNGKRSDPSLNVAPSPSVLRQLLLRNRPVYAQALDSSEELPAVAPQPADDLGSSYNSDFSDYNVLPASPSVSRLTALLRTLRSLQKENEVLP